MSKTEKPCEICGKVMLLSPSEIKRRTCSLKCKKMISFNASVVKHCVVCQKEMRGALSAIEGRTTCSRECSKKRFLDLYVCEICGVSMVGTKGKKKKTCSSECYQKWQLSKQLEKPCEVCGALFASSASTIGKKKTCSPECHSKWENRNKESKPCAHCGELIYGSVSKMKTKQTCGPKCRRALMLLKAGENKASKPCEICGTIMVGSLSQIENRKTCSRECFRKSSLGPVITKRCSVCGIEMTGPINRLSTKATCSRECYNMLTARKSSKPCEICGVQMVGAPSSLEKKRTCSRVCSKALQLVAKVSKPCSICGVVMSLPKSLLDRRETCSPACFKEWRERKHIQTKTAQSRRKNSIGYPTFKGNKKKVAAELMAKQKGKCAACGIEKHYGQGGLVIDHCHHTGVPRGLLCHGCNIALGGTCDSPDKIRSLLKYAEQFKQLKLVAS